MNTIRDRFGSGESKPEKEIMDQPEISGELSPSMPPPNTEDWEKAFPRNAETSTTWDDLSEVPFSGSVLTDEPYEISKEEFDIMLNGDSASGVEPLSKDQLATLKDHIKSGRIVVFPDDEDDNPKPPQKVLKKVRKR